jgi:hypothetical protein
MVASTGPNARLVRYGRVTTVSRRVSHLIFRFEPDSERGYLDRGVILAFAAQLGMHSFEDRRTHWAIKDGELPPGLLDTAVAERPERTVDVVAAEYISAKRERRRSDEKSLSNELETFPPSLEKALSLLPSRIMDRTTPELYPLLGVRPRTPAGRAAIEAVLARHGAADVHPLGWPFSLAWFLDVYGSPTESTMLDQAVKDCTTTMRTLSTNKGADGLLFPSEAKAIALWQCARSSALVGRLRRDIGTLTDQLVQRQAAKGCWIDSVNAATSVENIRATALATVALQRLGDDKHHPSIRRAVTWLIEQRRAQDGAFSRFVGDTDPDVFATVFTMEALRRSDLAADVPHVVNAGDAWLVAGQTVVDGWVAAPWPDDFVAAIVLDYLKRSGAIHPQLQGYLLMARDFVRKAEELRLEGGANNRRLAAIATVHAVEMFLYGLFERREDLAISAFRENGTETIGPREALRVLQESLQRLGILAAPRLLSHRDQLNSLIGRRDGIIHRAQEISIQELGEGMQHARKFIEKYGAALLTLDLLE